MSRSPNSRRRSSLGWVTLAPSWSCGSTPSRGAPRHCAAAPRPLEVESAEPTLPLPTASSRVDGRLWRDELGRRMGRERLHRDLDGALELRVAVRAPRLGGPIDLHVGGDS